MQNNCSKNGYDYIFRIKHGLAVYGDQWLHGERAVVEDDARLGTSLYAVSKIFNEHQADWYNRAFDMAITGIRPGSKARRIMRSPHPKR